MRIITGVINLPSTCSCVDLTKAKIFEVKTVSPYGALMVKCYTNNCCNHSCIKRIEYYVPCFALQYFTNKPSSYPLYHFRPADNMSSSVRGPRDSLFLGPSASLDVFDLTDTDMVIRPLHASILGQDHCFQITTSLGTKFYSCRSADERDKWIERYGTGVWSNLL